MTEAIRLDLTRVPFSRAGSYLALSLRDEDEARPWEQRPGKRLYLRTVRGDRETDRVFHLEAMDSGCPVAVEMEEATPHRLRLTTDGGALEFCLTKTNGLRIRGTGSVGLRMTLVRVGGYGNAQPYDREGRWLVNAWPARMCYLLTPLAGRLVVDAPERVLRAERVVADFAPGKPGSGFEALVEEFLPETLPAADRVTFDEEATEAAEAFTAFQQSQPPVPDDLRGTASLMAYIQWSAIVAADGHLRRPAMLMSKNHMTNVWSWDHCFNALALMAHSPDLAWDQFLIPFDHQDAAGALPDSVNDKVVSRNFTKPPIHGWTLLGLLARDSSGFLTDERLSSFYGPLARWTRWWLTYRDQDDDGVPQYNHGNDSGWDNSTAFDVGFPLESPDLCAYLVLQMDALAEVARRLDRPDDATAWTAESDGLLDRLMTHSWRENRFLAPRSETHEAVPAEAGDSLLPFLPLVLGDRLPPYARAPLLAGLLFPGRFLTDFGLATEAVGSPRYESDGYWRGPVWAPPVMLIADGLRRLGEASAARAIAARFCRSVVQSGAAENFDALTGDGLRDRAYTWTASVFLILAREYLSDKSTDSPKA